MVSSNAVNLKIGEGSGTFFTSCTDTVVRAELSATPVGHSFRAATAFCELTFPSSERVVSGLVD
jgi:hypothetical protein